MEVQPATDAFYRLVGLRVSPVLIVRVYHHPKGTTIVQIGGCFHTQECVQLPQKKTIRSNT